MREAKAVRPAGGEVISAAARSRQVVVGVLVGPQGRVGRRSGCVYGRCGTGSRWLGRLPALVWVLGGQGVKACLQSSVDPSQDGVGRFCRRSMCAIAGPGDAIAKDVGA